MTKLIFFSENVGREIDLNDNLFVSFSNKSLLLFLFLSIPLPRFCWNI